MKKPELLAALYQISRSMHTLDIEELLHLILEGVTKTLGFDRARLYLCNKNQQILELKMAVGMKKEEIQNIAIPIYQENSVIARALLEKKPQVVKNAEKDPRVHRGLSQLFNLKSFAAIPLIARDKAIGVISADHLYSQKPVSEEKVEALMMFAHEGGLALDNADMFQRLQNRSFQLADQVQTASQDLNKTIQYLERSEKLAALGQLAAGVAHEIRNPLTSIKILIHSLVTEKEEARRKEDVDVITHEVERLENIVNEFLEFGRLRPPQLEGVDLAKMITTSKHLFDPELKKRKIQFQVELPEEKVEVIADKEQLSQIFFNLTQNAMDAIGEKGEINLKIQRIGKKVEIRITDNGPGIAKEIRDNLFDPFTTTKEGGTGLGLSIVHRIVDSFGGSIQLENHSKGACFLITLHANKIKESVLAGVSK